MENEELKDFLLENGIVFRRGRDETKLMYVPSEMEDNVIRLVHEKIGHQSTDKCCDTLTIGSPK